RCCIMAWGAARPHAEESKMNVATEQAAHGLATRLDLPALVRSLRDVLGQRLVAVIAGVSDAKAVGKWARGERSPHPEAERRLRRGPAGRRLRRDPGAVPGLARRPDPAPPRDGQP